MKTLRLFVLFFTVFSMQIVPVVPEIEVWSNGVNYRYIIKDWETDYIDGRISIKQQEDIIWAAEQKKAEDTFVLAEDVFTYSDTNEKIKNAYKRLPATIQDYIERLQDEERISRLQSKGSMDIFMGFASPRYNIIKACQTKGICNYNTECNQANRCIFPIFPVFRYLLLDLPTFEELNKEDLINHLEKNIKEINQYPFLQELFKLISENFEKLKVARYSFTLGNSEFQRLEFQVSLNLINAKTIHKLIEWNTKKHGFICVNNIFLNDSTPCVTYKETLEFLGYKMIKHVGTKDIGPKYSMLENDLLKNALDLRSTFQQIFTEQKDDKYEKNSFISYLRAYKWPIISGIAAMALFAWH